MLVRPRAPLPEPEELGRRPLRDRRYLSRREFAARHGADRKDLAAIEDFATEHGLRVRQASAGRRSVVLVGPARTDGVRRSPPASPTTARRTATTVAAAVHLHVPANVAPAIEAVLGLDDRPQAAPAFRVVPHERVEEARKTSFTPVADRRALRLPTPSRRERTADRGDRARRRLPAFAVASLLREDRQGDARSSPRSRSTASATDPGSGTAPTARSCSTWR